MTLEEYFYGLFILIIFILSALAHEMDIIRQCNDNGNSGMATWTTKIKCEVIKIDEIDK
jgi:hypothetical protein